MFVSWLPNDIGKCHPNLRKWDPNQFKKTIYKKIQYFFVKHLDTYGISKTWIWHHKGNFGDGVHTLGFELEPFISFFGGHFPVNLGPVKEGRGNIRKNSVVASRPSQNVPIGSKSALKSGLFMGRDRMKTQVSREMSSNFMVRTLGYMSRGLWLWPATWGLSEP